LSTRSRARPQVVLNRSHDIKPLSELSNGQLDSFRKQAQQIRSRFRPLNWHAMLN
jgi:hypothetical protein